MNSKVVVIIYLYFLYFYLCFQLKAGQNFYVYYTNITLPVFYHSKSKYSEFKLLPEIH